MTIHRALTRVLLCGATPLAIAVAIAPAHAQSSGELAQLRAEIAALKAEQEASARRIAQLEATLDRQMAAAPPAAAPAVASNAAPAPAAAAPAGTIPSVAVASTIQRGQNAAAPVNPAGGSAPGQVPVSATSALALSGDLRLRYESNFGDRDARGRDRLVMRGRLRAAYKINDWLTIGGQLSTGDPNDPNSTDVTLTGFDNDLQVSLEQAYLRGTFGNLTLTGGKVPQTWVRTEMVWDGDIAPEGAIASYAANLGANAKLRATGMYFVIDEAPGAKDSHMIGGQLQFEASSGPWKFELAPSYYDYRLSSTAGADAGDVRTNRFAGGRYLSDFNLLNVIGAVNYNGLGPKWPVRVVGDFVHNYGATTNQDTGWGVDVLFGRGSVHRDWRFGYGYAQTGVDAVFAAFSHDNTDLATNYRQHSLFAEYVVAPHVILNTTLYHYKPKSALFTPTFAIDDWINRVRFNMLVTF